MANYSFWALGESHMTISDGAQLDGITQGDGSHLEGKFITLDSYNFEEIFVSDSGSDTNFDDNDGNQRLNGAQSFDGASYGSGTRIEAEYKITLQDPTTGDTYEAVSVNVVNSSTSYATVEGLAFVDVIPPAGVALEVIDSAEGPRGGQALDNSEIAAPACFTPGTLIATPGGPRPVERFRAGDLVLTRDRGAQPLVWTGQTVVGAQDLRAAPHLRPVLIAKDAFGPGLPEQDMRVSPQHRILISGPTAELLFGEPEVLAAALHLVNGQSVRIDDAAQRVIYLHLQCAAHEILISNGLPSESYHPAQDDWDTKAPAALHADGSQGARVQAALSARPTIKRHEARLWCGEHPAFSARHG